MRLRRASPLPRSGFARKRASPFLLRQKGAKDHASGATAEIPSCGFGFPALLAPSGPARTTRHILVARPSLTLRAAFGVQIGSPCRFSRTSLCSDMRALLPLGATMQLATSLWLALRAACGVQIGSPADLVGVVQGRPKELCFGAGHPWPRSRQETAICFVRSARRKRAVGRE